MGLIEIIISIICRSNNKNKPIIKALTVLNNLGIDARIWHIFERSNFEVNTIINEIVRIAIVHTKINEGILLDVLKTTFRKIEFSVVVNGTDEFLGERNVVNISLDAAYTIEFYTIKPISCIPLKLSAILSQGIFKNGYNTFVILFVKAIAKIKDDDHVVRLVNMDTYLNPISKFFALQMIPNTI
ncbi:MAG: hypothetical protein KAT16_11210, partial [Candidatus Heimdallarchaeota archaeon]|nr:hypothetical protein [Candidatus Heimdallarchaeota archaeon]